MGSSMRTMLHVNFQQGATWLEEAVNNQVGQMTHHGPFFLLLIIIVVVNIDDYPFVEPISYSLRSQQAPLR